jgi:hypothetical protein
VEKEFDCGASAAHKQSQVKNVENPRVKATRGAPTSLRSATPSSINVVDIQERIYESIWDEERIYLLGIEVRDRSAEAFRGAVHRRSAGATPTGRRRYDSLSQAGLLNLLEVPERIYGLVLDVGG